MMSRKLARSRYERRSEQNIASTTGASVWVGNKLMAEHLPDGHGVGAANDASVRMHMFPGSDAPGYVL
jgi:hypothetical protein